MPQDSELQDRYSLSEFEPYRPTAASDAFEEGFHGQWQITFAAFNTFPGLIDVECVRFRDPGSTRGWLDSERNSFSSVVLFEPLDVVPLGDYALGVQATSASGGNEVFITSIYVQFQRIGCEFQAWDTERYWSAELIGFVEQIVLRAESELAS